VYDEQKVRALGDLAIDVTEKGFGGPRHQAPVTARELTAEGVHARDGWLSLPRPVLSATALRHNIAAMAGYCEEHGIALYPHGKTTMAPQVVAAQLLAGAAGVTIATVAQARVFHGFGVRQVLVANQVVDDASVAWLARQLSADGDFVPTCYVDSVPGTELLDAFLSRHGASRPLQVLVELGHEGGRTGARTAAEATEVADAVARAGGLTLVGVAGYEGSIIAPTVVETLAAARAFCHRLGDLAAALVAAGRFDGQPMVTAGGSAYFDTVVDALAGVSEWQLALRSGCYVAHDHGLYQRISPFERAAGGPKLRPALTLHAPVLSRPERGTAVVGVGRRDLSFDAGLPVLLAASREGKPVDADGAAVDRLFDQHLVFTLPEDSRLSPGDEVTLGISHPCTTFDKWRWLPVVDDDDRIVDVIRTFF
jgi:D-serine dehydratase